MQLSAYSILLAIAAAVCLMSTSTNANPDPISVIASEEKENAEGRAGEVNSSLGVDYYGDDYYPPAPAPSSWVRSCRCTK